MIWQANMPGKCSLASSLLSRQGRSVGVRLTRHEEKEQLSCCSNWASSPIPYFNLSVCRGERSREMVWLLLSYSSFLSEDEEIFYAWSVTCRNTVIATYLKRLLTYSSSNWVSFSPINVIVSWPRKWKLTLQYHLYQHSNKCLSIAHCEDMPGLP